MTYKNTMLPTLLIALILGIPPDWVEHLGSRPKPHPRFDLELLDIPYPHFRLRDSRPERDFPIPGHAFRHKYARVSEYETQL